VAFCVVDVLVAPVGFLERDNRLGGGFAGLVGAEEARKSVGSAGFVSCDAYDDASSSVTSGTLLSSSSSSSSRTNKIADEGGSGLLCLCDRFFRCFSFLGFFLVGRSVSFLSVYSFSSFSAACR